MADMPGLLPAMLRYKRVSFSPSFGCVHRGQIRRVGSPLVPFWLVSPAVSQGGEGAWGETVPGDRAEGGCVGGAEGGEGRSGTCEATPCGLNSRCVPSHAVEHGGGSRSCARHSSTLFPFAAASCGEGHRATIKGGGLC